MYTTFIKDGKFLTVVEFDKEKEELPGTWKLEGNTLELTGKGLGPKTTTEKFEIKFPSDDELVMVDSRKKMDRVWKRVKADKK